MIAGIAWIGTSFYFVALDFSLKKPDGLPAGVRRRGLGSAWRRLLSRAEISLARPPRLPEHLIWFKWEAYLTWVTGFLLLVFSTTSDARAYLIDPAVLITRAMAGDRHLRCSLDRRWLGDL